MKKNVASKSSLLISAPLCLTLLLTGCAQAQNLISNLPEQNPQSILETSDATPNKLEVSDTTVKDSSVISQESSSSSEQSIDEKKLKLSAPVKISNIVSEEEQKLLKDLCNQAGIADESSASLLEQIKNYNTTVGADKLIDGIQETTDVRPLYNVAELYNVLDAHRAEFIGNNCRMTTFDLMKQFMSNPKDPGQRPEYLFIDQESLASQKGVNLSADDLKKFNNMYASVLTENTDKQDVHLKKILDDFKARNVEIKPEAASVISVYMHAHFDQDYLFVGHTGVLFPHEDGFIFLEKVSFDEPYQLVYLSSKAQLNEYLLAKYDDSDTQATSAPLIFENDKPMKF